MRLTGLFAVLLFVIIIFFAAPAASHAQTAPNHPLTKSEAWRILSLDATSALDEARRSGNLGHPFEMERDGVCYTMRTYVVAREERDSDSTRIVRYTKCLPAWKLEFKSATARPSAQPNE